MKRGRRALVASALLPAALAWAGQGGGLVVRVFDAGSKAPVADALVVLGHATGGAATTSARTDADGVAFFPVLLAGGGYRVEVSFPDYAKVVVDDVRIRIDETLQLPLGLSRAIREHVEVSATREVVDLDRTAIDTRFTDEFIRDLPVAGRLYQNVLKLAPGVLDADGDGNPNVHGARARDFKTLVGGVSNVDPFTGKWLSYVNADSIEEIQVVTAGAGVEFGRAQGGVANIIQKQGTNELEALVGAIYRSSKLDGAGATNMPKRFLPDFETMQPFVQVSGPIVRDRLWYFLAHEHQRREDPLNTLNRVYVTTRTQTIAADRITWQVSPRNKLSFRYQLDPFTLENVGVSSRVPPESSRRHEHGGPTYALDWTAPVSARLLVDASVAYQDIRSNVLPMQAGVRNDCILGPPSFQLGQCNNSVTGQTSGSYFQTSRDRRQRLTVRAQAELYGGKLWGVEHHLKAGVIVENERYYRTLERRPLGDFSLLTARVSTTSGIRVHTLGMVNMTFSAPARSAARATGTTSGFYLEDRIKPRANLAVTLGLRVEREMTDSAGTGTIDPAAESTAFLEAKRRGTPDPVNFQQSFTAYESLDDFVLYMSDAVGVTASYLETLLSGSTLMTRFWRHRRIREDVRLSNTNLSPFLGASWDPWSDGKTKLAFSLGRHYNNLPLAIPAVELEPVTASLNFQARREAGRWVAGTGVLTGSLSPGFNVTFVDRKLKTPYQDELALSFERELRAETAVRLSYIRRRFRDQLQDIDVNHAPGDYGRCFHQEAPGEPTVVPVNPGPDNPTGGDGVLDDCVGAFEPLATGADPPDPGREPNFLAQRPDGIADAYVLNPGWGSIFRLGNYNKADYVGVVLELDRRNYRGWDVNASYTWSKAHGEAEDYALILGDDRTTLEDERGLLSYDQTHVLKVNAAAATPWGFRLGGTVTFESGLPYSLLTHTTSTDALPPQYEGLGEPHPSTRTRYVTHRRNDQRNEPFWTFDVKLQKEQALGQRAHLVLSAEIFNLLNNDALTILEVTDRRTSAVRRFGRRYQLGMKLQF